MPGTSVVLTPTTPPDFGTQAISHTNRTTFADITSSLRDYLGSNVNAEAQRSIVRATLDAMREFINVRPRSYLYYRGRVQTHGTYSTGTIQFQTTSGTYPNQVTLTGGTWPSWAGLGTLAVSNVVYEISRRVDDTNLVMDAIVGSAADIAAGSGYR